MARRCRNCPEKPAKAEVSWQETVAHCNAALETLARCVATGASGDPLPQMRKLASRLNTIIQTCENRDATVNSLG